MCFPEHHCQVLPPPTPPEHCLRPEHEEVCCLNLEGVNTAEFVRISNDDLKNTRRLTEADNQLQRLRVTVLQVWPETKQEIKPLVAEYWTYRDEIGALGYCIKVIVLLFQLQ